MHSNGSILSLDVGDVRIGVAVASSIARLARPLTTIQNGPDTTDQIAKLIKEEGVDKIVVGLPRNMKGEETAQSNVVRQFAKQLTDRIDIPVYFKDETLTSVEAEKQLRSQGKPFTKSDVDALAAALILEDFLNETV